MTASAKGKPPTKPNLYLVGFMGSGKSVVSRSVAHRLRMRFVDSDHAIETEEGRSIREIFETDGESAFRRMEWKFIESAAFSSGYVIACGGGLVAQPKMLDLVRSKGLVVCLLASPDTVYERVRGNPNRPLLNVENPLQRIRELLAEREPIYRRAGPEVLTDGRSVREVAAHVARIYRAELKARR